jgi:predicted phosphodiesterase
MRLLVISDVHADANALDRVLAHAAGTGWDQALFLGDAVGYGSEASTTLELLRSLDYRAALRGNHEEMLEALREGRRPNAALRVTSVLAGHLRELDQGDLAFIDRLQAGHLDETWGAVHGALRTPFEYLISVPIARSNASHMKRDVYFVGHTHVPAAYICDRNGVWRVRSFGSQGGTVRLEPGSRAFLNPGAVSLPRDRVPGNCYGVFDEESREFTVFRLS